MDDQTQTTNLNDQIPAQDTMEENWKRALADYQNLVKQVAKEKMELTRFASLSVVSKLIPVLDSLDMAATHTQDQGVILAVKQFKQMLTEEGVEVIEPKVGDVFDHRLHECIEIIPGEPDGTLASLVLIGYKLGDYLIRPAKVTVYKKHE